MHPHLAVLGPGGADLEPRPSPLNAAVDGGIASFEPQMKPTDILWGCCSI